MKYGKAEYQRLLKQTTSLLIAARDIAGVIWQVDDTLADVTLFDKDPVEAIGQARRLLMEGIDAMDDVLKDRALEKPMNCGHERRFTLHQEGRASLCALCELEMARGRLRMFEEAGERTIEVLSRETEEDRFQREH